MLINSCDNYFIFDGERCLDHLSFVLPTCQERRLGHPSVRPSGSVSMSGSVSVSGSVSGSGYVSVSVSVYVCLDMICILLSMNL